MVLGALPRLGERIPYYPRAEHADTSSCLTWISWLQPRPFQKDRDFLFSADLLYLDTDSQSVPINSISEASFCLIRAGFGCVATLVLYLLIAFCLRHQIFVP
jgi:hypothetical protein